MRKIKRSFNYNLSNPISNLSDLNHSFALGSLKVAYPGMNRNGTNITREAFETSVQSMFNCPIVANYDVVSNTIGGHNEAIVETENGERWINITEPLGVVPESASYHWETLEDDGVEHDYFCIDGVILWKRQPCYAKVAENGITEHSMEISIVEGSMKEGIFSVDKFEFEAFCLLERDEPCFEQSALQVFSKEDFANQWKEMLSEYAEVRKQTDIDDEKIGGSTLENEVITNIEETEVVETPAEEVVVDNAPVDEIVEETPAEETVVVDEVVTTDEPEVEETDTTESVEESAEESVEEFALNSEIGKKLHQAIGSLSTETTEYWVQDWDENEVYAMTWPDGVLYGFGYTVDGENVVVDIANPKEKKIAYVDVEETDNTALVDTINAIVEAANTALSADYDAQIGTLNETITTLNASLGELTEYKNTKLAEERSAAETELFTQFESKLKNVEEFNKLKENASDYSLDELETQCFALLGKANFSLKNNVREINRVPVDYSVEAPQADAYGGLLRNKNKTVN